MSKFIYVNGELQQVSGEVLRAQQIALGLQEAAKTLEFTHVDFGNIRVVVKGSTPWFVARDVCRALGIENSRKALTRLDDDEKSIFTLRDNISNPNVSLSDIRNLPNRGLNIINEYGLYTIILSSRKKISKRI